MVIGSRYITGGGTPTGPSTASCCRSGATRTRGRCSASTPATARAGYPGATGRRRWRAIEPDSTSAEGYAFLTELVRRLTRDGATVVETPIMFRDRTRGKSKMSGRIIAESMLLVTAWGVLDRWRRLSGRVRR